METRTETLRELYDAAAKTPVPVMAEMDRILGHRDRRSSDAFMCTPVLGNLRRKLKTNVDFDIETRMVSYSSTLFPNALNPSGSDMAHISVQYPVTQLIPWIGQATSATY